MPLPAFEGSRYASWAWADAAEETYFAAIRGNRVHASRAGGPAYYELPGMSPAPPPATGTMPMPIIRESPSSSTDKAFSATAGFDFGPANVSAGYSHSTNTGESWTP